MEVVQEHNSSHHLSNEFSYVTTFNKEKQGCYKWKSLMN